MDEVQSSSSSQSTRAPRLDPEEATTLQTVDTLLGRLRTTVELLKAQVLAASSSGSDVEASSPRSIHSARRDAAVRSDLWNSMRQDAAQLHSSLSGGSQSPEQQRGQSLPGSGQSNISTPPLPSRSISEPNIDQFLANNIDWGGLEQYFPELQEPSAAEMLGLADEGRSR